MENEKHDPDRHNGTAPFVQLTAPDFAAWGIESLAYVKPVVIDGEPTFAIHAADGEPLGYVSSGRETAFAAVRQHDLEPQSVH